MGLKEMFELSALLKMQLPVLTSLAVFRWLIGLGCILLCKRFGRVELATRHSSLEACRRTLSVFGWSLLLLAIGQALENAQFDHVPHLPDACEYYSNFKVQGYLCAASLLCLVTSNTSIDLGLSLAALKGVADMSMFTVFLSTLAWSRQYMKASLFFTVVLLVSAGFSAGCYTDGSKRIGSAVLAIAFSLLFLLTNAACVCLVYTTKFTRSRLQALWKSCLKLVGMVRAIRVTRKWKLRKLD